MRFLSDGQWKWSIEVICIVFFKDELLIFPKMIMVVLCIVTLKPLSMIGHKRPKETWDIELHFTQKKS